MTLSANVEALLDVYAKCLGQLHIGGSSKKKNAATGDGSAADEDQQSSLAHALQSDRDKVMQAFSSRLSESGTRLAQGDTKSRSALRRIVHRLTAALATICGRGTTHNGLHTSSSSAAAKGSQLLIDYDALRALSSASRVGAIHAIDDLSVRLQHQPSRQHAVGRTMAKAAKAIKPAPSREKPKPAKPATTADQPKNNSSSSSSSRSNSNPAAKSATRQGASKKKSSSPPPPPPLPLPLPPVASSKKKTPKRASPNKRSEPVQTPRYTHAATQTSSCDSASSLARASNTSTAKAGPLHSKFGRSPLSRHLATPVSMLASSSASTRLGEIPQHKLKYRYHDATAAPQDGSNTNTNAFAHCHIRPAYPMRPLWVPDDGPVDGKKSDDKKRRFWGLGRRDESKMKE